MTGIIIFYVVLYKKWLLNVFGKNYKALNQVKNHKKAQSNDSVSVMSGKLNGVNAIVKPIYPRANFTHCYTHQQYFNIFFTFRQENSYFKMYCQPVQTKISKIRHKKHNTSLRQSVIMNLYLFKI